MDVSASSGSGDVYFRTIGGVIVPLHGTDPDPKESARWVANRAKEIRKTMGDRQSRTVHVKTKDGAHVISHRDNRSDYTSPAGETKTTVHSNSGEARTAVATKAAEIEHDAHKTGSHLSTESAVPVDEETAAATKSGKLTVPTEGGEVDPHLVEAYQRHAAKLGYKVGEFTVDKNSGMATASVSRASAARAVAASHAPVACSAGVNYIVRDPTLSPPVELPAHLEGKPSTVEVAGEKFPVKYVRKEVARVGKVVKDVAGNPFEITEPICRNAVRNFKAMKRAGMKVFIPTKHQHVLSGDNRGYVTDLQLSNGSLYATEELIGQDAINDLPRNGQSIYLKWNAQDDSNPPQVFPGHSITHIAMVPDPQMHGLKPFESVAASMSGLEAVVLGWEGYDAPQVDLAASERVGDSMSFPAISLILGTDVAAASSGVYFRTIDGVIRPFHGTDPDPAESARWKAHRDAVIKEHMNSAKAHQNAGDNAKVRGHAEEAEGHYKVAQAHKEAADTVRKAKRVIERPEPKTTEEHEARANEHYAAAEKALHAGKTEEYEKHRDLGNQHSDKATAGKAAELEKPTGESKDAQAVRMKSDADAAAKAKEDADGKAKQAEAEARQGRAREHSANATRHANAAQSETALRQHGAAADHYEAAQAEHMAAHKEATEAGDAVEAAKHKAKADAYAQRAAESHKKALHEHAANASTQAQGAASSASRGMHEQAAQRFNRAAAESEKAAAHAKATGDSSEQYHRDAAANFRARANMHGAAGDYQKEGSSRSESGGESSSRAAGPGEPSTADHLKALGLEKTPETMGELKTAYRKAVLKAQESFRADATPEQQAVATKIIAAHEALQRTLKAQGVAASVGDSDAWGQYGPYYAPQSAWEALREAMTPPIILRILRRSA